MKSPIPWVGGKSAEAAWLTSLLPPHTCYVEVFGGGASVLLAKRPSEVEVYNDLNGELVNFFRVVKERPEEFKASWKWSLVSREEFYRLREANPQSMSPVERAYRFVYIVRTAFGGIFKSSSTFGIGAESRSNLASWLENYEEMIDALHARLRDVYIENADCLALIKRWDASKSSGGTVFFVDPPYLDTADYAVGRFTADHHRGLAQALGRTKNRFLMTINDHPMIRALYDGYHVLERTKRYSVGREAIARKEYPELVISNYPLPKSEQLSLFGGPVPTAPNNEPPSSGKEGFVC